MDQASQNEIFMALGRIEANQTSLRNELLGEGGRVTRLEESVSAQKKLVEKHERVYVFGRWAGIPLLGLFNIAIKSAFTKLGWS